MSLVAINWNPDAKEMRKFGISTAIGCGVIGAVLHTGWPLGTEKPILACVLWILGGLTGITALIGVKAGRPLYLLWMGFGHVMGNIVSRVLLTLVYFLVVTPIGLLMRLFGRDSLQLRRKKVDTYWHDVPKIEPEPSRYERQF